MQYYIYILFVIHKSSATSIPSISSISSILSKLSILSITSWPVLYPSTRPQWQPRHSTASSVVCEWKTEHISTQLALTASSIST